MSNIPPPPPPPPSTALLQQRAPAQPLPGCPALRAHQAPELFELWQAWEQECGQQVGVPFWGIVWPGAVLIARYLLAHPLLVAGKRVLDLGCGGAMAGLAAAQCGAREVVLNDIDPVALHIARLNAALNNLTVATVEKRLDSLATLRDYDVILVADFFYERTEAAHMEQLLRHVALQGCVVLIADGQRPFAPSSNVEQLEQQDIAVPQDVEGVGSRRVRLVRLPELCGVS